jgi:hypothetical protein
MSRWPSTEVRSPHIFRHEKPLQAAEIKGITALSVRTSSFQGIRPQVVSNDSAGIGPITPPPEVKDVPRNAVSTAFRSLSSLTLRLTGVGSSVVGVGPGLLVDPSPSVCASHDRTGSGSCERTAVDVVAVRKETARATSKLKPLANGDKGRWAQQALR